ncbi:MAG: hypothetical protein KF873_10505 [Gemmataceae bacterium]|nr:hypothetical protein [Gemmataceae bacterium]
MAVPIFNARAAPMAVATQSAILSELITTAKDYKKRYPNALGFVVAWIREMDVPAWEWITDWYGDPVGIKAKPRCVAWCNGG